MKRSLSFEHLEPRKMLAAYPLALHHSPALVLGPVAATPTAAPAVIITGIGGHSPPTSPSRGGIAPWRPPGMIAVPYTPMASIVLLPSGWLMSSR